MFLFVCDKHVVRNGTQNSQLTTHRIDYSSIGIQYWYNSSHQGIWYLCIIKNSILRVPGKRSLAQVAGTVRCSHRQISSEHAVNIPTYV